LAGTSAPSEHEIRNRRITAVALVVGAAIALLAIADFGPFADETTEDRVRDAVERVVDARASLPAPVRPST
jgi:hypothetical protein